VQGCQTEARLRLTQSKESPGLFIGAGVDYFKIKQHIWYVIGFRVQSR